MRPSLPARSDLAGNTASVWLHACKVVGQAPSTTKTYVKKLGSCSSSYHTHVDNYGLTVPLANWPSLNKIRLTGGRRRLRLAFTLLQPVQRQLVAKAGLESYNNSSID